MLFLDWYTGTFHFCSKALYDENCIIVLKPTKGPRRPNKRHWKIQQKALEDLTKGPGRSNKRSWKIQQKALEDPTKGPGRSNKRPWKI
ncbi:hypothetical protein TNIN_222211 [Trichonephila inaurata madagascariensis]|uniref:Uncharacterized protein n=1 Tax=Trichonephila inaurata madagascariensis TaxID=2747483 RepID=A0A8X6I866_9ARAC|nr:hypothetical protein TNIN_222211 [Trichonephila inaurata madagascariensis]